MVASDKLSDKFKFKEIKFYSTDEWMAGATKKYRKVFDKAEVRYIWIEFSFYNKLFDEQEWTAKISLKAYQMDGSHRKDICNLESVRVIKTEENIVYIRDGWGNETAGAFWKKGDFAWEVWVNDELAGTEKFYVEDVGLVSATSNPYCTIESIKLYEAGGDNLPISKRKYLKQFNRNTTRYVWVELNLLNNTQQDWNCELFYNFYDSAGLFKAQTTSFGYIQKNNNKQRFTYEIGWGSDTPGSWRDSRYTLEVVFMGVLTAVIPFETGDQELAGLPQLSVNANTMQAQTVQPVAEAKEQSPEEIMLEIEQLIGLQEVKKKIKDHIAYLNFIKIRKEKGFEDSERINLHSVFTGNPGTGKTTVVKLLGKLYRQMGLLSQGHVVEAERADLVAEYIGQTAPKTKKMIDEARGGILFIDEAYSLVRDDNDSKDYGKEVIEVLLKEMSDGPGDIAIMVAGYPREMDVFLDSNPGLKSRFSYYFHFDDYLPEELIQIADYASKKRNIALTADAREFLRLRFIDAYRDRDKAFGNARFVHSLVDEAKMNMGLRIVSLPHADSLTKDQLSTIELPDVQKIFASKQKKSIDIKVDEPLLRSSLDELNALTGMKNIKEEITELVKLIRYYREIGKDVLNKFSLHFVFTGNPGTGKTTVARIVGKIFKALGLLERGHVIECDRQSLVAGYIGQTAIKTKEMVDRAANGVLFIDEAYALAKGNENDFGNEAIEVILKNMEDRRGQLSVIVAGYPDNMNTFLESNPGLKSRFNCTLLFADYNPDELYSIALSLLAKENLRPDAAAENNLKSYFTFAYQKRDKFFGNARFIRNVVETAVKNQNLRMASYAASMRTNEMIETLSIEDVKEFAIAPQPVEEQKTKIGFK